MGDNEQELSKIAELYPHSVECSRNAKGTYQWTIKVRYKPDDKDDPIAMVAKLEAIDLELKKKFPVEQGK